MIHCLVAHSDDVIAASHVCSCVAEMVTDRSDHADDVVVPEVAEPPSENSAAVSPIQVVSVVSHSLTVS